MARRSGQKGYIERKGNWWHVRFRIDTPGQEKRKYASVPICPTNGAGKLTSAYPVVSGKRYGLGLGGFARSLALRMLS